MGMEKFKDRVVREARGKMKQYLAQGTSKVTLFLVWLVSASFIWLLSPKEFVSLLYSLGPPTFLLIGIYLEYVFNRVPQEIYDEIQTEINSFDWRNIDFDVEKFNIFGLFGYCVKISNSKNIELENVLLYKFGRRDGQERTRTAKKKFGYIDRKKDTVLFQQARISAGGEISFAITASESCSQTFIASRPPAANANR